ncbi:hypothetical protein NLI96_g5644 [Meripilus lineatus]|uniref:Sexual development protein n=1 Tax=Meripilus lineatus TaxID=2056292 RepID=A0AAD5V354_9APHY|nr:hypothetical protein NLI96_g5644 [Physisporinus lineatus]
MRFSVATLSFASLAALAAYTFAAPIKRTVSAVDLQVLQFAYVLELFETSFYTQALSVFQQQDFINAGFQIADVAIQQFQAIQIDETTHVSILQSTISSLGATPLSTCQFNFNAALQSVEIMAATARLVENLGVSAYLGAAHLITDPILLTAAASIVTIEARHQTLLNIFQQGSAIPQAFDIPFMPSEVLALASPFISGCDLGISAFPTLTVTNTEVITIGTTLSFSSVAITSVENLFCQMIIGGSPFATVFPISSCVVPNVNGPVAIWITSDSQPLLNNPRDRATDKFIAGPTMIFVDSSQDVLGQLARGSSSSLAGLTSSVPIGNTVISTITPGQASAVISSAFAGSTGLLTVDGLSPVH